MAGLALGSYLSGKYWSLRNDSLRLFAGAETVIGIAGFLMPLAILLLSAAYSWLYRSFAPSFEILTAVRFLLSVIMLAVPCAMMGATLPLITNWTVNRLGATERVCGIVYGTNTAGAVFGCVFAGFFLIREFGVVRTSFLVAGVNCVIGLASLFLARIQERVIKKEKIVSRDVMQKVGASDVPENRPGLAGVLMAAYALSGFSALALEIAWTKALGRMFLFSWSYQMDSYAFAAILAVILFGIGAGSCAATFAFRKTSRYGTLLVCVQWLLGISVLGSIAVVQHPIAIRDWLFSIVNAPAPHWLWGPLVSFAGSQIVMQILMATVLLGVPALLMGMAFPLFTLWYNRVKKNISMSIGTIYSSKTLGAIFGSVLTGFFLVPAIGLLPTIALLSGIYCLTALALQYIGTRSWKRTGEIGRAHV
jgi:spermidine synthase